MSKTQLTKDIETRLVIWLEEIKYEHAVLECTLGYRQQHGIVDALSYTGTSVSRGRGKPRTREVTWKCYEIKTSKQDFYSNAKWSFVGHYNYFVFPKGLFEEVEKDIPSGVGVLEYVDYGRGIHKFKSRKRASRRKLLMDEGELLHDYIVSANRDVRKHLSHHNAPKST